MTYCVYASMPMKNPSVAYEVTTYRSLAWCVTAAQTARDPMKKR
jgi:hypothetical protein